MLTQTDHNLIVLSHAIELGTRVIKEISGEAISTHIQGEPITLNPTIKHALCAKIQNTLLNNQNCFEVIE